MAEYPNPCEGASPHYFSNSYFGTLLVEAGQWIQCPWRNEWQNTPIHAKELLPIILAIAILGDPTGVPLQSKYFVTTWQSLTSLASY